MLPPDELLAGTLALVQAQSAAEASITSLIRSAAGARRFKAMVREAIGEAFGGRAHLDYADANHEYSIDAVIEGPRSAIGVAAVPSDIEAERAVAAKLKLEPQLVREYPSRQTGIASERRRRPPPARTDAAPQSGSLQAGRQAAPTSGCRKPTTERGKRRSSSAPPNLAT